jgi:aspartyl-tRNA(Asn)/glutamyl-tRNA(Gln) amidotransferase subunit A
LQRAEEIDQIVSATLGGTQRYAAFDRDQDNICVRGMQTSCGSRILGDYQAPYNATVIERRTAPAP